MKKIICFVTILFLGSILLSGAAAQTEGKRTIAILYFENNSLAQKTEMDPLCKGLTDMLITEFSKISQFQVVERSQLQKLVEEISLGQSGMVDAGTAQQVGNLLGARNLLLGSFMNMFDGQIRIDVRIVEVETGITIKAEEETGKPKDLYKLISKLVAKVIADLDVKISKADAQKLGQVENTSFNAAMYYARGLEYEDAGDLVNAKKMYASALKENKEFTKARLKLEELSK
ncbi:MAG TPA: CsgG/HfaB family protein [bacterium]|nr:CsgG/HfaB family protein [bacterium]HPN44116.1 CsgG/HfaB family protein [bacterium]